MVGRRSRRNTHQKNCINSFIGASATNDLPNTMVASLGLPEIANHPEESIHHMGLFFYGCAWRRNHWCRRHCLRGWLISLNFNADASGPRDSVKFFRPHYDGLRSRILQADIRNPVRQSFDQADMTFIS
jgi:hypothetical protein